MTSETGESSSSKPSDDAWAKLVPLDTRFSDIEIRCSDMVICSEIKPSSSEKHEWCRITKNLLPGSATLHNKSLDAILVDEAVIPKDGAVDIMSGSEIVPGLGGKGYLQYRFTVMPAPEPRTQLLKISIDPDNAKCSICLNVWHDVVTAAPCLHNFCNGCFSEWMRRSEEKHQHVLCPQCRTAVQYVGRNHFLQNIQEDILKVDTALRRPAEDIAVLDSSASVQSNLIIGSKRKRRRNTPSPAVEDRDSLRLRCPQCVSSIGGYRCEGNGAHLQCHLCRGMIPFRANLQVPLHCMGCDRPFCGAYWSSANVTHSESGPVCSRETFRPITERTATRIPFITHEMNRHEQDITQRCIVQMGKTVNDVAEEWLSHFNNRQIDRSRMPLNHAEMITASTHTCNDCYDKLVGFLLYWFRITLPRDNLPADAATREDCWYGYACRTQHHNEEHARKRNHFRMAPCGASYLSMAYYQCGRFCQVLRLKIQKLEIKTNTICLRVQTKFFPKPIKQPHRICFNRIPILVAIPTEVGMSSVFYLQQPVPKARFSKSGVAWLWLHHAAKYSKASHIGVQRKSLHKYGKLTQ